MEVLLFWKVCTHYGAGAVACNLHRGKFLSPETALFSIGLQKSCGTVQEVHLKLPWMATQS